MRNIGVDLHKNNFQVCYLGSESRNFKQYSIHGIEEFKKSLKNFYQNIVNEGGYPLTIFVTIVILTIVTLGLWHIPEIAIPLIVIVSGTIWLLRWLGVK